MIEVDVAVTRDRQLVAFHDQSLMRLTGKNGQLNDIDLGELQTLTLRDPFGRPLPDRVPSLSWAKGRAYLMLDVKTPADMPALTGAVCSAGIADSVFYNAVTLENAQILLELAPDAVVALKAVTQDQITATAESRLNPERLIVHVGTVGSQKAAIAELSAYGASILATGFRSDPTPGAVVDADAAFAAGLAAPDWRWCEPADDSIYRDAVTGIQLLISDKPIIAHRALEA